MLQLSKNKKILILLIILFLLIFIFVLLIKKQNNGVNIPDQTTSATREMTEIEKSMVVGIDPSQEAEVLNESDGLYIYRIK